MMLAHIVSVKVILAVLYRYTDKSIGITRNPLFISPPSQSPPCNFVTVQKPAVAGIVTYKKLGGGIIDGFFPYTECVVL